MRVYEHPNGQRQAIEAGGQDYVWVHPKAKKLDFKWSASRARLFSARAYATTSLGDKISDMAAEVMREGTAAVEANAQVIYEKGYCDAIAHCYCPGATIEMASRVQAEARRLGL